MEEVRDATHTAKKEKWSIKTLNNPKKSCAKSQTTEMYFKNFETLLD